MSNPSSPVKSPLTFNSNARASPFRRPESPVGRSPSTIRASTPQGSPLKQSTPTQSTDRSWRSDREMSPPSQQSKSPIPFRLPSKAANVEIPTASSARSNAVNSRPAHRAPLSSSKEDALTSIPPHHLHTMRESFSVLDRSNNGYITPADVVTSLSELGLDSSGSTLSAYFPSGTPSLNLASYLNLLSRDLAQLSRQDELMAAFSAFDDDDSGQIDVLELRDALLSTPSETGRPLRAEEVDAVMDGFIGRRVLKKGQAASGLGGKKEVFRYGDFVSSVWGRNDGNTSRQGVQG